MVSITDKEFAELAGHVYKNCGIKLGREKKALVLGRLSNFLVENDFASFSEYYSHLAGDRTGLATVQLINMITTNHTFFLRETSHFDFFRDRVLPVLTATARDKDLRIWSAGCSTGQEAYTLSMIIAEYLGPESSGWDTKLLATDISEKALNKARQGLYTAEDVACLPARWLAGHFTRTGDGGYAVNERLRNSVIFRKLNLMDERFPFKRKFQVIFCRNVMIYFDRATRNRLAQKLYDLTEDGGYLFIGHAESLNDSGTPYKYVLPAVYRREHRP